MFLPGESQGWGAWWAAVYGVAQSQTRLKRLSSSSSNTLSFLVYVFTSLAKFIPKYFILSDALEIEIVLFPYQVVCNYHIETQLIFQW